MKNQQTCRRRKGTGLLAAAVFCLLLSSCNFGTGDDTSTVQQRPDIEPSGSINDVQVKDKASVYADDDDSIVTMYLTVRRAMPLTIPIIPGARSTAIPPTIMMKRGSPAMAWRASCR